MTDEVTFVYYWYIIKWIHTQQIKYGWLYWWNVDTDAFTKMFEQNYVTSKNEEETL